MVKIKWLILAILIALLPLQVGDTNSVRPPVKEVFKFSPAQPAAPSVPVPPANSGALLSYQQLIHSRGLTLDNQGVYVATLHGEHPVAAYNETQTFNPASAIKVATALAALVKFGPAYRMRTAAYADGTIDQATRTLNGHLVIDADGDPLFYETNAQTLAQNIVRAGVRQVNGDLVIRGPLSINRSASPENSAQRMLNALRRGGVRFSGGVRFETERGGNTLLVMHESGTPLIQVLLYMNAHSDNPIAERIGDAIGGPAALRTFLIQTAGVEPNEVYISRTSGLDYNRLSPRGMVQVLQRLMQVLDAYHLKPEDIMPVAGVDSGTLAARFRAEDWQGAVIGKTGSLPGTDGGVSTLAGLAYTKTYGPVLYAIFNTNGNVHQFRDWQDQLVEEVVQECGGPTTAARLENGLTQEIRLEPLVHVRPAGQPELETRVAVERNEPKAEAPKRQTKPKHKVARTGSRGGNRRGR